MLSAAHVLAMDAKNLLDVVDSVRIRYPDLFSVESAMTMAHRQCDASDEFHSRNSDDNDAERITNENLSSFPDVSSSAGSMNFNEDCIEQQTYQNLCKSSEPPLPSYTDEIYVNQIEPINTSEGIYDNDCIVNAQMKILNIDSKVANSFANTSSTNTNTTTIPIINQSSKVTPPISSTKPPLAAKPGKITHSSRFIN